MNAKSWECLSLVVMDQIQAAVKHFEDIVTAEGPREAYIEFCKLLIATKSMKLAAARGDLSLNTETWLLICSLQLIEFLIEVNRAGVEFVMEDTTWTELPELGTPKWPAPDPGETTREAQARFDEEQENATLLGVHFEPIDETEEELAQALRKHMEAITRREGKKSAPRSAPPQPGENLN